MHGIIVRRDDYDWRRASRRGELPRQLEPAHVRQMNVQHQTVGAARFPIREQRSR